MTSVGPRITKKNFSVSMVNTRSTRENKTKEGAEGKQAEPANEVDLETPDQSVDEVEKETTESTPMPNAEELNQKSMEFSPIDTVEDTIGNTQETVKDECQAKRTSFTERLAMMVEIKRHSDEGTESRERQNIRNSFHENDRDQPRRRPG